MYRTSTVLRRREGQLSISRPRSSFHNLQQQKQEQEQQKQLPRRMSDVLTAAAASTKARPHEWGATRARRKPRLDTRPTHSLLLQLLPLFLLLLASRRRTLRTCRPAETLRSNRASSDPRGLWCDRVGGAFWWPIKKETGGFLEKLGSHIRAICRNLSAFVF